MSFTATEEKLVIDIDPKNTAQFQDSKREDRFERIHIGGAGPVLYRKWEAQNEKMTDIIHELDKPWVDTGGELPDDVVARGHRLFVEGADEEEEGLRLDHGLIVMYHGTPTRTVAIINGEIIDDDTAAMREELLEKDYPRYVEWGFRVEEVILTDGPRERERLSEAQEQKRNRAESKMFDSQREFFTALMEKFSPDGAPTHIDQVAQSPDQLLSKLPEDPSERRNLLNLIAAELEETVDEDVDNDLVSAMSDFGVESPVEAAIASKKKAVPAKKASRTKK